MKIDINLLNMNSYLIVNYTISNWFFCKVTISLDRSSGLKSVSPHSNKYGSIGHVYKIMLLQEWHH